MSPPSVTLRAPKTSPTSWWGGGGRVLVAIVLLGIALRIVAWMCKAGFHYPDEIFQVLEPANLLRTGDGWLPWEFARGLRSWLLPYVYAGLLENLDWLGLRGLAAQRAATLYTALWTAAMVPAAFRMGRAMALGSRSDVHGVRAGLFAALLVAAWPAVLYFSPHTLQGTPSMIFLVWGYAHWLESRNNPDNLRSALWMGVCFGFAGAIRYTAGLHMLVPLLDLVARRRVRALVLTVLGSLPGVLLLGAVDWVAWGKPFHSLVEHITYNFFEDGASHHGTDVWHFYLVESLGRRAGPALPLVIVLACAHARRTWPVLLTAAVPTVLLSAIAHKEERFLMANWPLVLVAVGVGVATLRSWILWRPPGSRASGPKWANAVVFAVLVAMLGSNLWGTMQVRWRWREGVFHAQDWVGRQADATGLLIDGRQHLNGGYVVLGRSIPLLPYSSRLATNSVFNYVALQSHLVDVQRLRKRGWKAVATFDNITVLRAPGRPYRASTTLPRGGRVMETAPNETVAVSTPTTPSSSSPSANGAATGTVTLPPSRLNTTSTASDPALRE